METVVATFQDYDGDFRHLKEVCVTVYIACL